MMAKYSCMMIGLCKLSFCSLPGDAAMQFCGLSALWLGIPEHCAVEQDVEAASLQYSCSDAFFEF
jgi:hypothetical protein